MTRRLFLKGLVAAGVVAAVGLPLFEETLPKLSDYPGLEYERDYVKQKLSYLHSLIFRINNTEWHIVEYSFDEELHPEQLSFMIEKSKEAGYLKA